MTRPARSATSCRITCSRCWQPHDGASARNDADSTRDEKAKVLKSMPALVATDVVRGQFRGYRDEKGVAADFPGRDIRGHETGDRQLALAGRAFFHPRRKNPSRRPLRKSSYECVTLRKCFRPTTFTQPSAYAHQPMNELGIGINVMDEKETGEGQSAELLAHRAPGLDEKDAYERVLTDALSGDRTLFAREDYVEEAWASRRPGDQGRHPCLSLRAGRLGPEGSGPCYASRWLAQSRLTPGAC